MLSKKRSTKFILTINLILIVFGLKAQVSGRVFKDFNANGTYESASPNNEVGQSGVIVKAYGPSGALTVTYTGGGTSANRIVLNRTL